jgi:hypothetical protein
LRRAGHRLGRDGIATPELVWKHRQKLSRFHAHSTVGTASALVGENSSGGANSDGTYGWRPANLFRGSDGRGHLPSLLLHLTPDADSLRGVVERDVGGGQKFAGSDIALELDVMG